VLGAIAAGEKFRGESLGLYVICAAPDGVAHTRRGFESNADAIRHGEAGVFPHVLDAIDELSRQPLIDELRR
jgi:hypothetical protein